MFSNLGILFRNPGFQKTARCGVCKKQMKVRRNILGSTGYNEALSGHKHLHDRFECPDYEQKWHQKLADLVQEMEGTASKKIKQIIIEEIAEILQRR